MRPQWHPNRSIPLLFRVVLQKTHQRTSVAGRKPPSVNRHRNHSPSKTTAASASLHQGLSRCVLCGDLRNPNPPPPTPPRDSEEAPAPPPPTKKARRMCHAAAPGHRCPHRRCDPPPLPRAARGMRIGDAARSVPAFPRQSPPPPPGPRNTTRGWGGGSSIAAPSASRPRPPPPLHTAPPPPCEAPPALGLCGGVNGRAKSQSRRRRGGGGR